MRGGEHSGCASNVVGMVWFRVWGLIGGGDEGCKGRHGTTTWFGFWLRVRWCAELEDVVLVLFGEVDG